METAIIEQSNVIGAYIPNESIYIREVFRSHERECVIESTGDVLARSGKTEILCCAIETDEKMHEKDQPLNNTDLYILFVHETAPCRYEMIVCYQKLCNIPNNENILTYNKHTHLQHESSTQHIYQMNTEDAITDFVTNNALPKEEEEDVHQNKNYNQNEYEVKHIPSIQQYQYNDNKERQKTSSTSSSKSIYHDFDSKKYLERVRSMFTHAYDSYMEFAYPEV